MGKMDAAIANGKNIYAKCPEAGDETLLIKIEVSSWIWEEFKKFKDMDDAELRLLEFVAHITK